MWEAIRSNRRRSWWLIAIMGVLLVCLGAAIGLVFAYPHGGLPGAGIALLVWLVPPWGAGRSAPPSQSPPVCSSG